MVVRLRSGIAFPASPPGIPSSFDRADLHIERWRYYTRLIRSLYLHVRALPYRPDYQIYGEDDLGVRAFKERGWHRFRLSDNGVARLTGAVAPMLTELRALHDSTPPDERTFNHSGVALTSVDHPNARALLEDELRASCGELMDRLLKERVRIGFVKLAYFDAQDRGMFDYGAGTGAMAKYSPWHLDMNINELKVNLYLSEVGVEQGPMHYVTGSHLLHVQALLDRAIIHAHRWAAGFGFADSWMNTDKALAVFHSLPSWFQRKNIIGDAFGDSWPQFERDFASRVETFLGPPGTAVLFESLGLHQGGFVTSGSRVAIQVNLFSS